VMRYTRYTRKLKEIVDAGAIGELVSLQHLEPVGYWHQAHSYVRGNWRNTGSSTFMLLAKSCHDLDWISYFMGGKCLSVASFGSLVHFKPENKPAGAAERCLDCVVEANCPYSAVRIYLGRVKEGALGHPVSVVAAAPTLESVTQALRSGPYGRCVYACDNDVVDHQVVNMLFEGGRTADFTMTGFTRYADRHTRLFGTRGEITGDGRKIEIFDFLSEKTTVIDAPPIPSPLSAHGGGDFGLMQDFVAAVAQNNPRLISSTPDEILNSHMVAFAAERARLEKRVVEL
jgi:predicted dehydrogenase